MTRDDAPRFKEILAAVYGLYRKELTRMTLQLWMNALKGYDIEVVSQALSVHVQNPDIGQFLPMPADIVKLIEGGSDDAALRAWAKVDRAVRMVGSYHSVVFDDPLIHYAIAAVGGWIELGRKREEDWPFVRNQLVTLYRGARMRSIDYPAPLLGIAEAHNAMVKREIAPPILIGDAERCSQVLARGRPQSPLLTAQPVRSSLPALERQQA